MNSTTEKVSSFSQLAASLEIDVRTFRDFFDAEHHIDMMQLGWHPGKNVLPPAVVTYIKAVVIGRKSRLEVFPSLKTLK